ncbi:50S ribosomal protein L31 [compost metagenome]
MIASQYFTCYNLRSVIITLCTHEAQGEKEVKVMNEAIQPKYHLTTVTCACGNTFETGSVKQDLRVEICSNCHPFFTGKQKFLDAGGRVDKFKKKYGI